MRQRTVLICCAVARPARALAAKASVKVTQTSDRDCGLSSRAALATFDPDGSCWRTAQTSWITDGDRYSATWPRAGMTASGTAYQLPPLAPLTAATGYSRWPTPLASDEKRCREFSLDSLRRTALKRPSMSNLPEWVAVECGGYPTPEFVEWLMGLPVGWTDIEASETL